MNWGEKCSRIPTVEMVMGNRKFDPNWIQNIIPDMVVSKIVQKWISREKMQVSLLEKVMEIR